MIFEPKFLLLAVAVAVAAQTASAAPTPSSDLLPAIQSHGPVLDPTEVSGYRYETKRSPVKQQDSTQKYQQAQVEAQQNLAAQAQTTDQAKQSKLQKQLQSQYDAAGQAHIKAQAAQQQRRSSGLDYYIRPKPATFAPTKRSSDLEGYHQAQSDAQKNLASQSGMSTDDQEAAQQDLQKQYNQAGQAQIKQQAGGSRRSADDDYANAQSGAQQSLNSAAKLSNPDDQANAQSQLQQQYEQAGKDHIKATAEQQQQ